MYFQLREHLYPLPDESLDHHDMMMNEASFTINLPTFGGSWKATVAQHNQVPDLQTQQHDPRPRASLTLLRELLDLIMWNKSRLSSNLRLCSLHVHACHRRTMGSTWMTKNRNTVQRLVRDTHSDCHLYTILSPSKLKIVLPAEIRHRGSEAGRSGGNPGLKVLAQETGKSKDFKALTP